MKKAITYPKILPPTLLLVSLMLMFGLHFLFPAVQMLPALGNLAGLFPFGLGILINIVADRQFKQAKTTVKPFEESNELVTTGLYRFSRNPMYLGMVLILLGLAILLGSLTPFSVLTVFVWWIDVQFIRHEEQMLATQFGQDWLEYKAQVRRWI